MGCLQSHDKILVSSFVINEREILKNNSKSKLFTLPNPTLSILTSFLRFDDILNLAQLHSRFSNAFFGKRQHARVLLMLIKRRNLFKGEIYVDIFLKEIRNILKHNLVTLDTVIDALSHKLKYSLIENKRLEFKFNSSKIDMFGFELFIKICNSVKIHELRRVYGESIETLIDCGYHSISYLLLSKYYSFLISFFISVKLAKCGIVSDELTLFDQIINKEIVVLNRKLNYSYNFMGLSPENFSIIIDNMNITWLNLRTNKLGDENIRTLCLFFKTSKCLMFLDITENNITAEGVIYITEFLNENKSLSDLLIGNNMIDDKAFSSLSSALIKNNHIQKVDLSYLHFTGKSANSLFKLFKYNKILKMIYLVNNNIGEIESPKIFEGLKENTSLNYLNLSFNKIGCIGAMSLSHVIRYNRSIAHLDLQNNMINHTGAIEILNALNSNASIQKIYLGNNNFTVSTDYELKHNQLVLDIHQDEFWKDIE